MSEFKRLLEPKRILLATDGSRFSEGAVREAINLGRKEGARLFVISVAQVNTELMGYSPEITEKIERQTRQTLETVSKRAAEASVSCETIFHEGEEPYIFIVNEAKERDVDFIIMGRRGLRGLMKLMLGSVTALVIGHSDRDVFVVPRAGRLVFKKILICTDGSEQSQKAFKKALVLADKYNSSLIAISVATIEDELKNIKEHLELLEKKAKNKGLAIETLPVIGTPYEAITTTAQVKDVDLIVIGSHGRTGIKKLLLGSVAERVIALAQCSVLVTK
ncbi:MAG: universal stress protein [Nitrospirae bacterium]|nr:universal stress protein [Nitrospirota bacterium]